MCEVVDILSEYLQNNIYPHSAIATNSHLLPSIYGCVLTYRMRKRLNSKGEIVGPKRPNISNVEREYEEIIL